MMRAPTQACAPGVAHRIDRLELVVVQVAAAAFLRVLPHACAWVRHLGVALLSRPIHDVRQERDLEFPKAFA